MFKGLNKKQCIRGFFAVSLFLLVSCGEPKINASSNKSIRLSIDKIRESLPIDKLALFNSSLRVISIKYSTLHKKLKSKNKLAEIIDGKTGLEIIAEAEKIRNSIP